MIESVDARHWVQQGHVLCSVERQTLSGVVVHHLWDAGEHAAALIQGVAIFFRLGNNYMNASLTGPDSHTHTHTQERKRKTRFDCAAEHPKLITDGQNQQ